MDQFLTPKELADVLKVKPSTIYIWVHRDIAPPYIKNGATLRFPIKDVEDWIAKKLKTKRRNNFED